MKKIASLVGLLVCTSAFSTPIQSSQQPFWQDIEGKVESQNRSLVGDKNPLKQRELSLDENRFRELLFASGSNKSARSFRSKQAEEKPQLEINLPLPNGGFVRVKAINSPILSEELELSHPEIKTWRVVGVDNPAITGRMDFTTKGFHGILVMADGETIFIDPDKSRGGVYHSLSKRENVEHFNLDFDCEVHGKHSVLSDEEKVQLSAKTVNLKETAKIPAKKLITYRLAIAATAEFTAKIGGSRKDAYESIVTTINRVNQVYQRDLGIKLKLVTDEQYVYTNASTDPYTNKDKGLLIKENATNLATNLGVDNFDIGHVFAQGKLGGLAYIGVACIDSAYISQDTILNGIKGGGTTGLPNPRGEIFSVDFVGHEIGHQLGAYHTFNSLKDACAGGRSSFTAVEPGSGSTIMAYSGICGTDNLQFDADAMFHFKSIEQINNYTRVADIAGYTNGSSCGVRTSLSQQQPIANAGGHENVPFNTPFVLKGEKSVDGSTYTWDQFDSGLASAVDVDTGNNAIIRSLLPTVNPLRYIPRLSDLFAGTHTIGEQLPQRERTLAFAFTVRDGRGAVATMFKNIHVKNNNGFRVLSQFTAEKLSTNQTISVHWDVGGTNNPPIGCGKVDIQLLRVDGTKNMLLAATNNDGSEQFTIPAKTPVMTNARIMVACSSQPFFQISAGSISIEHGVDNNAPVISLSGPSNVEVAKGLDYVDAGATATDDFDSIVSVITTGTVDTTTAGVYTLTYTATDGAGNTASKTRTVTVVADTVAPVITLNGSSIVYVYKSASYIDKGAVASDDLDKSITVSSLGSVDTSVIGVYTITYAATDNAGNRATPVTRTVNVVADTAAPTITLNGDKIITINLGETYLDAGAVAVDNIDGVVAVSSKSDVDTNTVGIYAITYTAVDSSGNTVTKDRVIIVEGNANLGRKKLQSSASGGGSFGLLLLPLALFGLRKRLFKFK